MTDEPPDIEASALCRMIDALKPRPALADYLLNALEGLGFGLAIAFVAPTECAFAAKCFLAILLAAADAGITALSLRTPWAQRPSDEFYAIFHKLTPAELQELQAREFQMGRIIRRKSILATLPVDIVLIVTGQFWFVALFLPSLLVRYRTQRHCRRAQAEWLCHTEWARTQPFHPDTLRLEQR